MYQVDKNETHILAEKDPAFHVVQKVRQQTVTDVYLSKEIGPPSEYIDLLSRLRNAEPSDSIFIHLNTPGGYVDSGVQIINAMRDCPARIVTVLDGTVCSMGSLIFLAADEYIVHDNTRLMFHNYSGGTYGKGNEQIAQLESTVEWFTAMFYEICYPFLTEDELDAIVKGQDLWLNSEDIKDRLFGVVKFLEAEAKRLDQEDEVKTAKKRKKQLLAELKKIEAIEAKTEKQNKKLVSKPTAKPAAESNTTSDVT
jgi:ATP-dependent protease ClpP protease subunit